MSVNTLLILGCGWVGMEVANRYSQQGVEVWATTTDEQKRKRLAGQGINAIRHDFDDPGLLVIPNIDEFSTIIVSVPASRRHTRRQIEERFTRISASLLKFKYGRLVFLSSVGIYPDVTGYYDEGYDQFDRMDINLLDAEYCMRSLPNASVFRLGGLFGKDRIFAKYFQNRVCETGEQNTNFIHLDDVMQIIDQFVGASDVNCGVYNLVAPQHPTKKEVILASARKYGFEQPAGFTTANLFRKIVSSEKIIQLLNYKFKYPSPLEF